MRVNRVVVMLVLALLVVTSASAVIAGDNGGGRAGDVVPDSYIVVLAGDASADAVLAAHGLGKGRSFDALFNGFSANVPPGRVKALRADPRVLTVSANRIVKADVKPDKPGGGNGGGGGAGKNKPPNVTIASPADTSTFGSGETISFAGSASDDKDGDLSANLSWSSNIDGQIGNGATVSAVLGDGQHTITASVTDSGGKTGSDSVTVTVGSVPPPNNQIVPSGVARIGAAPSDNLSHSGAGVGVAIVDTGIDLGNADLMVSATCYGFWGSCQDGAGHGTHVSGIVAALDNLIGVVGVAPGATVYAVKVLDDTGSGDDVSVIAGLTWVVDNAGSVSPPIRVVNMSLGRPASGDDSSMRAAVNAVAAAGITIVTSAGNDPNVETSSQVPAKFTAVMAIASTTAEDGAKNKCRRDQVQILADTASYFTTDGGSVAVSAPGERREDVMKGCSVAADGILSLAPGGGTARMFGTSMAAPHVAGVVALMWDQADDSGGSLSPGQARIKIVGSAIRQGQAPLNSPTGSYSYDGSREGIVSAPGALGP